MNTKQLKQKILSLAIQGKLVPQDQNDEPASVLLDRIREKKAYLIREGKLKKDKHESIIYMGKDNKFYEQDGKTIKCIEDDIPFEIPDEWVWCRMGNIGDWGAGSTPSKGTPSYYGGDILWLTTGELNNGIVYDTKTKITEKALKECSLRINKVGDILIAMYGATIGKLAIVGKEMTTNQACCACTPYYIYNYYLFYFLMASKNDFINKGEGGAQPNISREKLIHHLIPIPPLAEQHRIVEKVESLFTLIDTIEKNKESIKENIKATRQKLLSMAIQGKLVQQDPNDEPAIELLKRINPNIQPIVEDVPFDIPNGWEWIKIKNVFLVNPKNKADDQIDAGFVSMANISEGYSSSFKVETKKWKDIKKGFTHFANGDVAVAKISPCFENRKSVVFCNLPGNIGAGTTELHVFRPLCVEAYYALYFFKTEYFINQCVGTFIGNVGQQRVGKNIVEEIYFPFPPLGEQRRIVEKLALLFAQLNDLEKHVTFKI